MRPSYTQVSIPRTVKEMRSVERNWGLGVGLGWIGLGGGGIGTFFESGVPLGTVSQDFDFPFSVFFDVLVFIECACD